MTRIIILLTSLITQVNFAKEFNFQELYNHALTNHPQAKIMDSKVREIEYGIKKIRSSYYPELSAVVGGEKRKADKDDSVDTERFVAEIRLKYDLFKFNQSADEINSLEEILKKQRYEQSWWKESLRRQMRSQYAISQAHLEKMLILKEELKTNQVLKGSVSKRRRSGLIGESDLLDIELRQNHLLSLVNDLEEELDHSLDKLRKLSYIGHDDTVKIEGKIPHHHVHLDLSSLIKAAKENNIKIKDSLFLQNAHLNNLNKNKKNLLPEVNLSGRYGRMRIDEQYANSDNQNEGLVGIYVNIPLFDGGNKRSTREIYQEKYQQKLLETELSKNNETIELTHKYELLDNVHRKVDLLEQSLKRGNVYFKNVMNEYKRGVKNSLDLVSSRDRLLNLNLDLIDSKTKYLLTILNIEELTGENLKEMP